MAVSGTDLLWGYPQMNFKANPPFNENAAELCGLKKKRPAWPNIFPNFLRIYIISSQKSGPPEIRTRKRPTEKM